MNTYFWKSFADKLKKLKLNTALKHVVEMAKINSKNQKDFAELNSKKLKSSQKHEFN